MAAGGSGNGLYEHLYTRFFENREYYKGYDFQHAPGGSVAPVSVTFAQKLRWWKRDRLQREIVGMRRNSLRGSKP